MAKKTIRRRKPLTEEQKAERRARLAEARKKRGPAEHKSVHPDVPREDDHPLGIKNVRKWIKTNKEEVAALRAQLKREPNDKKARTRFNELDCYVQNLEAYLRSGTYLDFRYGEQMEGRVKRICRVMAYHWEGPYNGMIKREVGVIYPDVGLWTDEMNKDYYDIPDVIQAPKKKRRKRKAK